MLTVRKRAICLSAVVLVSIYSHGVFIFAKKLHFRSAMNVALVFLLLVLNIYLPIVLFYCPYCPYNLLCCRTLESVDINDENNDIGKFVKPLIFYDIAKSYKKCLDSVFLTAEIRTD